MNVTLKTGTHTVTARRTNETGTVTYYRVQFDGFTAPMCRWIPMNELIKAGNDPLDLITWEPAITSVTIAMAPAAVKVAA